ncbi:hypothetical protein GCM10009721_41730 [Terrabacter tumescens]|uniref:Glycosyltransferase RgtA/B/C/D-like domain-containing protein n=1 Tax=Terrabacter tumescens TaxID=60443 RepID=A0ABQ2IHX6_9MICO|nr:hypothetical protein [Terrabacter tumescens]GGN09511.1 hypothetical protein GCM10009721_41730 [Terrabacter tumescens]
MTSDTTSRAAPADLGKGSDLRPVVGHDQDDDRTIKGRKGPLPLRVLQALPGLIILIALVQLARPIGDPDTFWHLAAGDRLRQTWIFNGPDPWSTMSTQPWRLHEWLPELLMSVTQQLLGMPGVAWLLPLGGAVIGLTLWRATRPRASLLASAAVTSVAFVAMSQSLSLRPHLLSFAFAVAFTAAWLRSAADARPRWWLIPVTWVWACTHGMWFFGVVIGVVALAGIALDRAVTRRQWLRLALVPLGSLAAAAITPTGPSLLLSPFAVNETTQYIEEWMPPSIRQPGFIAFLVLAGTVVLVWARSRERARWTDILLVGLAIGLALLYSRTVAVGAAVIAPVAAATIQGLLPRDREPVTRREVGLTLGLTALGLLVAALLLPSRAAVPTWGANDLDVPLAALPQDTVVCNSYGVGGWLIWRHPNVRPTIDGRTEIYATGHVKEHVDFERAAPGWQAYVSKTGCTYALLAKDQPVVEALSKQAQWTVVQRGSEYVLLRAPL